MYKVFKFSFYSLLRSFWLIAYLLFFIAVSFALLAFAQTFEKAIVSMMSISLAIIPLISLLFGIMYYYSSREFVEFLLSQPLKRSHVFMALLASLSVSLSLCFVLGLIIPFGFFGIMVSPAFSSFLLLLITGVFLTIIFVIIAFYISLMNENRIKGFGLGILIWLYFAVLYDAIFLGLIIAFQDYPIEGMTILLTLLNPIDMARVLVLLKLEISSLMGYTGAVFNEFFGSLNGILISFAGLALWVFIPLFFSLRNFRKKDL